MIYITGDCHGEYGRFNVFDFKEQDDMTKDDYVIICGDFGYWLPDVRQDIQLDAFASKNFTTLFIDGNHEMYRTNRDLTLKHKNKYEKGLYDLPVEEWHGGKVHKLNDSVIHLMRGQVFDIRGLTFFTFGGARSHDIDDGIIDPDAYDTHREFREAISELEARRAMYRIKGWSWWPEELPSEEEMAEGLENLAKHGNKVDYILSHEGPADAVALYGKGWYHPDDFSRYLQKIDETTEFKTHFFGHYHDNVVIDNKRTLVFEKKIRIE